LFIASTHDYLLVFLDNGRMHWLKVYDIPSMARQSKGRAIVNLLQIGADEKICTVIPVREFDDRFLVTATRKGQIKKTDLKAYSNTRKGGILATGLGDDDEVIGVAISRGNDEIVLGTANGQAIRFKETDVRNMGRTAAGVRGINLRDHDEVIDMIIVDPMASLLTLCENGHGKRTGFDEYRLQSRGGYGIINIKATERNGKVVGMKTVRDADELMLITQKGMIVRTGVSGIREIGRATQGVRIIALKSDDKLMSIARVVTDDDDKETDGDAVIDGGVSEETPVEAPVEGASAEVPVAEASASDEPVAEESADEADVIEPAPEPEVQGEEDDVTML
jgi:DNA gyrase subunit A